MPLPSSRPIERLVGLVSIALILVGCTPQDSYQGKVILEGAHSLAPGETLIGDLVIVDGEVTVPETARVTGSLYLLGGTARVDGSVNGDVTLALGRLSLGETARVAGELALLGGSLDRAASAQIRRGIRRGAALDLADPEADARSRGRVAGSLLQALFAAALAWLLASYLPAPLNRVQTAVGRHPLACAAMGGLTGMVLPALLVFMAFTIVLIPLALLLGGGLLLTLLCGWIGVGTSLGRRFPSASPRIAWLERLTAPQQAFLGTLALMLVAATVNHLPDGSALLSVLEGIGLIVILLVTAIGLGAMVLTRFGTRMFVPHLDAYRTELPGRETGDRRSGSKTGE